MCTNDVQFDFSADFGDSNYKSCFARSVAVNSQFHSKSLDLRQLNKVREEVVDIVEKKEQHVTHETRFNKPEESSPARRLSTASLCSRRNSDLPVETLHLQSQVDLLHWQLKQTENSRQMYRAVMQQVVCFLERAHRSLDVISDREGQRGVSRSRSEYHVGEGEEGFRDFTWRRPKRQQQCPEEIPPDKLSQEAFRLLRTAQSLLNTREPDLVNISAEPKDQDFLSQLAKEFPSRPQRTTSFSLNPQLISPSDKEVRISTAFNRKLSLQRTPSLREKTDEYINDKRGSICSIKKFEEKTGSVSSAEDESGFSSMNSFQEVGLPIINSTIDDELCDLSVNSSDSNITQINIDSPKCLDKSKIIWNRPDFLPVNHRRWSSTPVDVVQNDPLKVLWV